MEWEVEKAFIYFPLMWGTWIPGIGSLTTLSKFFRFWFNERPHTGTDICICVCLCVCSEKAIWSVILKAPSTFLFVPVSPIVVRHFNYASSWDLYAFLPVLEIQMHETTSHYGVSRNQIQDSDACTPSTWLIELLLYPPTTSLWYKESLRTMNNINILGNRERVWINNQKPNLNIFFLLKLGVV